jgi:2-polyprenyl-3-methyl-5-hydroxy-6-metoxy-1,4-benzoquinol methylase
MRAEIVELQGIVDRLLQGRGIIKVLEAGCGSVSHLRFNQDVDLVGIDISEKQLLRNTNLRESVLGDIQSYEFPPHSFDVIVCWDVLEHLPDPQAALWRFAAAVNDGGLIVLKLPNVLSLKGLVTKWTPHAVHVFAYRRLQGISPPDDEDGGPFRTYLRFSIAPNAIRRFAAGQGLQIAHQQTYDVASSDWLRRRKFYHFAYRVLCSAARILSLGVLGDSEYVIILRKP